MKNILFISLFLVLTLTIKIQKSQHKQDVPLTPLVGGYSTQNTSNLSDQMKQIDSYLKTKFPQLKNYKLVKAETQVVSGMNYRYTYTDDSSKKTMEYTVYDQPWTKTRQISQVKRIQNYKNDNGEQVTSTKTIVANKEGQYSDAIKELLSYI